MKYYHELFNDKWVIEDIFSGARGKYFVEAGAMSGKYGSATYVLEKFFDWKGICVEPHLKLFALLSNTRNCICDNNCLAGDIGITDFVEVFSNASMGSVGRESGYSGILEYLSQSKREYWKKGKIIPKRKITLVELLRKYNAPRTIDYLCLDTEGSEYFILKNFPFGEYNILAISVEGPSCNELLLTRGYKKVKNPHTDVQYEQYFILE